MEIKTMGKASIIILSAAFISIIILHFQPGRVINAGGCGPRALYSVACQLKVSCSEAQILGLFSDDGFEVSLDDMQSALPKLGLTGNIRDFKISDLLREKPVGILHIDDVHFVALIGYDGDALLIVDSLYQGENKPVRWLVDDLKTRWDGEILVVTILPSHISRL